MAAAVRNRVTPASIRCGITHISSGSPTAGHQARAGGTRYIFTGPGLASCRCRPFSYNVIPHEAHLRHHMKNCPFCAEAIQDKAVKCKHCGEWLPKQSTTWRRFKNYLSKRKGEKKLLAQQEQRHSVLIQARLAALAEERATLRIRSCAVCSRVKATLWIEYSENISYFFERRVRKFEGFVCMPCMTKRFLEYELKTLLFTWWGVIGLVVGPAYLLANLVEYTRRSATFVWYRDRPAPGLRALDDD